MTRTSFLPPYKPAPAGISAGVGVEVIADLGAQVGRLAASLDMADQRERERHRRPASDSNGPVIMPAFSFTSAQGLAGFCPQTWGPRTGFYWAIQRITVAGLVAASAGVADAATGTIAAATAGSVSLPHATDLLTGFTISLSTVGTAAMTVTVTNVAGGPYVYTILTGGSGLTVTYPQPVPSTGTAPNVAWSSTAAAVGNVTVTGLTAAVAQDVLTVYRGQSPSSAQPQNAIETLIGNGGYAQAIHIGGDGIILHPDDGLNFQGTSLAAATYYVNVDGLQITADKIKRYALSGSD